MIRMVAASLVMLVAFPALAQNAAPAFPSSKPFRAASVGALDVRDKAITLTVSGGSRASGHAGCNGWNAAVTLKAGEIAFGNIVTTKKLCPAPQMAAENAFLAALQSARRWRMDGGNLMIEGDSAQMVLRPDSAAPGSPAK